jgi:hypothetical protein
VASLHPDEKDRTDTRFPSHLLAVAAALCVMLGKGRQDQHGSAGICTAPDVAPISPITDDCLGDKKTPAHYAGAKALKIGEATPLAKP